MELVCQIGVVVRQACIFKKVFLVLSHNGLISDPLVGKVWGRYNRWGQQLMGRLARFSLAQSWQATLS